ncbi:hypothetical protein DY000_02048799 [Brassica cretica]|uniref:Uncharacterized protein n=1 Tax=Brassica cretica TaxID=69181 RepID=A0ABQ7F2U5_BRACR|nr:hypothetical protein DY000_02048799 [Brassica cretica]
MYVLLENKQKSKSGGVDRIRRDLEEIDDFGAFWEIFGESIRADHRARPSVDIEDK